MALLVPQLRAFDVYRMEPAAPLSHPLHVFVGERDRLIPEEDAAAWARHQLRGSHVHRVPSGHFLLAERAEEVAGVPRRTAVGS